VIADFNFNGELTMREKKHGDRSSAEMPKTWRSSSMINEKASGASDGQAELRNLIARRAYEIYEERGGWHGDDINDWLQAEVEVKSSLMEARLRPVASRART
jgi:hypothetical protein